ncbi:protein of unknown function [uncultured Woeseiaceae bacterium]|uniref:Uncharacterized protein n=1 Tax=uncultured Woeseiaceae bacterium TaxID=1983305 RepID=A0A7D9H3J1_9GAMM|nr:protein of unknown function [uncultured Woeseiaceae bacterium]
MSNSKKSDDCQPSHRGEPSESRPEDDETNAVLRDYNEGERPLLRSRAQRALRDVEKMLDEDSNEKKRRDIEEAIEHLERVVLCMADEPLPGITADALEIEDWLDYDLFRFQYSVNGSTPMLLAAFVTLVENNVAPGRWVLDPLAEAFARILEDQDPELVASRLGLQAQGSGSASPLKSFDRQIERSDVYFDMRTLIEDFDLSCRKAAEAVIEKFELDTSSKTLVNSYESRAKYPDLVRQLLDKYSDGLGGPVVWLTENARDEFLASFPDSAQRFLKEIRPAKT